MGSSVTTVSFSRRATVLWLLTGAIITGLLATMVVSGIGLLPIIAEVGFLVLHGTWRYGWRAVAVFVGGGLTISLLLENLSIITGFPFGHYHYTGDGTFLYVPWYIGPGYLATGYLAWVVATIVFADVHRHSSWLTTIGTPVVGAFAMTAWDLAMDPTSSTINEWWIWENGGGFFGVPLSNFLGWTFTVYLFMQVFALYLRQRGPALPVFPARITGDLTAVILYAATTLTFVNNYLTRERVPVTDPSGTTWHTGDIYESSLLLAVYGMLFFALLATLRIAQRRVDVGPIRRAGTDHAREPAVPDPALVPGFRAQASGSGS
jgi:putative membrane protein